MIHCLFYKINNYYNLVTLIIIVLESIMTLNKYETPLKIAVLSDSHQKPNLMEDAIETLKKNGAQYIIHAGDLELKKSLDILDNSQLKYVSVFGNNDQRLLQYQSNFNIYKEPYYFKIKDIKFKLMHLPYYLSADSDIVIFGHTHKFEHQMKNDTLFLNPGEICARNKNLSECVLLEISQNRYTINYYFKPPQNNTWDIKTVRYELN